MEQLTAWTIAESQMKAQNMEERQLVQTTKRY